MPSESRQSGFRRHSNQTFLTRYFQPHRPDIAVPVNLLRGQHKAADVNTAALDRILTVGTLIEKLGKAQTLFARFQPQTVSKCQITRTCCRRNDKLTEEIKILTDANTRLGKVFRHFIVN